MSLYFSQLPTSNIYLCIHIEIDTDAHISLITLWCITFKTPK